MPSKASNRTSRGVNFIAATLALSGVSFYEEACAYSIDPRFPHLGGLKISSPQNYHDPAVQSQLARLDFVVLDFYFGWGGGGVAMNKAVNDIKAKNPNIVIVDYCLLDEVHNTAAGQKPLRAVLDARKWWLYRSGTSGSKVLAPGGASSVPNVTDFTGWNTWSADYHFDQVWRHISKLDGTYTDNFFWKPAVNGDWNRDGTSDSFNDSAVGTWWRKGFITYANRIKTRMPGRLVMGNLGRSGQKEADNTGFNQQMNGGTLERYMGETWSAENFGWKFMMDRYRKVMALLAAPKLLILNVKGNPSDFRFFRYAFASTLMDNGYFDFSNGTSGPIYKPGVVWFDEYDLAGTANTKWLGTAVDPPQTSPWQNGVYRRRFQNGVAFVNPRGNGNRTVVVGSGYKRFKGKQAPTVNNGNPATSITLQDRDGILLKKN
ncbi:MAG: hypothetical protein ACREXX_16030 [Gammaproteobacteria bacterium]